MRSLLAPLLLLSLLSATARADGVRFKRVWPQWHDADSFQSLYEDRTGKELTGNWIVLRSRPEDRGGFYFLTRVENSGAAVTGATFIVHVINPDSTDTRAYNFLANVPKGGCLFEIGLTGKDWAGPRIQPVAWEIELHAPDGRTLAVKKSFLWEKPDR